MQESSSPHDSRGDEARLKDVAGGPAPYTTLRSCARRMILSTAGRKTLESSGRWREAREGKRALQDRATTTAQVERLMRPASVPWASLCARQNTLGQGRESATHARHRRRRRKREPRPNHRPPRTTPQRAAIDCTLAAAKKRASEKGCFSSRHLWDLQSSLSLSSIVDLVFTRVRVSARPASKPFGSRRDGRTQCSIFCDPAGQSP